MDIKDILKLILVVVAAVFIIKLLVEIVIGIVFFVLTVIVIGLGIYIAWKIIKKYL